ncbi:MAG: hypothetical protein R3D59_04700 [Paracoccaceae bacterium]
MKLCVIGNSHVGMLRAAARNLGPDGPELTFFAKAGAGIEKATIEGTVITARDPELRRAQARFGMPEAVDVARFDATVLVAGTASIYSALAILQDHRVSGWPSGAAPRDPSGAPLDRPADKPLVSESAFTAALADLTRDGVSYRFARAFRQASDVPIFVVPQPYPSERVFDSTRPGAYGFQRARRHGEGAAIATCLNTAIDRAFAEIGSVEVLHQPADTVAHGFTTARAFSRDAVRVDGDTAQHAEDLLHVGAAYGARVLERVYAGLRHGIAA